MRNRKYQKPKIRGKKISNKFFLLEDKYFDSFDAISTPVLLANYHSCDSGTCSSCCPR